MVVILGVAALFGVLVATGRVAQGRGASAFYWYCAVLVLVLAMLLARLGALPWGL